MNLVTILGGLWGPGGGAPCCWTTVGWKDAAAASEVGEESGVCPGGHVTVLGMTPMELSGCCLHTDGAQHPAEAVKRFLRRS